VTDSYTRFAMVLSVAIAFGVGGLSHAAPLRASQVPALGELEPARAHSGMLKLPCGVFDPLVQRMDFTGVGAAAPEKTRYAIVQFHVGQSAAANTFEKRGLKRLSYVPNNAFYVDLGTVSINELANDPAVRWVGEVQPWMKLAPELWSDHRPTSSSLGAGDDHDLRIDLFDGVAADQIVDIVRERMPAAEVHESDNIVLGKPYLRVSVDAASIDQFIKTVTALEGVEFVSPWQRTEPRNAGAIGAIDGHATDPCVDSGGVCKPNTRWDQSVKARERMAILRIR
jgi:hypothetical protein